MDGLYLPTSSYLRRTEWNRNTINENETLSVLEENLTSQLLRFPKVPPPLAYRQHDQRTDLQVSEDLITTGQSSEGRETIADEDDNAVDIEQVDDGRSGDNDDGNINNEVHFIMDHANDSHGDSDGDRNNSADVGDESGDLAESDALLYRFDFPRDTF